MSTSKGEYKVGCFQFGGPYGNRRKFWFVIALASWFACALLWWPLKMARLNQCDGILRIVLAYLTILPLSLYGYGIIVLFLTNKSFINVSHGMRWMMEFAFLVTCLGVPKRANNYVDLIIRYLVCFHLISVANLIASIKNRKNFNFLFSLLVVIVIRYGSQLNDWGIATILVVFYVLKYLDETLTDDSIVQHDHKEIQDNNKKLSK